MQIINDHLVDGWVCRLLLEKNLVLLLIIENLYLVIVLLILIT